MDSRSPEPTATRQQFLDAEVGRFYCENEPESFKVGRTLSFEKPGTPICYVDIGGLGEAKEGRIEVSFRNISDVPEVIYLWAEMKGWLAAGGLGRGRSDTLRFTEQNVPINDSEVAKKVCKILDAMPRTVTDQ